MPSSCYVCPFCICQHYTGSFFGSFVYDLYIFIPYAYAFGHVSDVVRLGARIVVVEGFVRPVMDAFCSSYSRTPDVESIKRCSQTRVKATIHCRKQNLESGQSSSNTRYGRAFK